MNPDTLEQSFVRGLASDSFAGVHPRILDALVASNRGHARAYGEDPATARVRGRFSLAQTV